MDESFSRRLQKPADARFRDPEITELPLRNLMKAMTAAVSKLELVGCKPRVAEHHVPQGRSSKAVKPGVAVQYATALTHDGLANGVLVTAVDGRPIKIEGNPDHPFSRGAIDPFLQAAILQLYDMDRSGAVRQSGRISDWAAAEAAIRPQFAKLRAKNGEGLALLTGPMSSPSAIAQIETLLAAMPGLRWYQHTPVGRDAVYEGTRAAFGAPLEVRYRLDRARFVVALDGDILDPGPHQGAYARAWMESRSATERRGEMATLVAAAVTPNLTSAKSDLRIGVSPSELRSLASALEEAVLSGAVPHGLPPEMMDWISSAAFGLRRFGRDAVVVVGPYQHPAIHALAHRINIHIGAADSTVLYHVPSLAYAHPAARGLAHLVAAMRAGQVRGLIILGANPVYDAPADLDFASALIRVDLTIHASQYYDETGSHCRWHLPMAHELEAWGDARSLDGTASLIQPLIQPLFNGKSGSEILSHLFDDVPSSGLNIVRHHWLGQFGAKFETLWREALLTGFVRDSRPVSEEPRIVGAPAPLPSAQLSHGLELVIRPDPTIWDGSLANNGWLQDLPKPLTRLAAENAVMISPATAAALSVSNGDEVEIATSASAIMKGPAWILPGQPARSITVHLGYGRTQAGRVGNDIGCDVYRLRSRNALWNVGNVSLRKTGRRLKWARKPEDGMPERDTRAKVVMAGSRAERPRHDSHATGMAAVDSSMDRLAVNEARPLAYLLAST